MRWRLLLLALALLAAPALLVGAVAVLERHASYHSPLRVTETPPPPRSRAAADLEEHRRKKAEEETRQAALREGLTGEKMVELGKELVHGRALCFNCHSIGSEGGGTQGPDLVDVGARAGKRVEGLSAVDYLTQSLYRPNAYVVEDYVPAMTPANEPPIGLTDEEILWVVAYLQSLGGEVTVGPDSELPDPDQIPAP